MDIEDFKKSVQPLRQATLSLLIKDKFILLGKKKRGFGTDLWNGPGGKPNANENIEHTMIRETAEEIGCLPLTFKNVAIFNFYFPLISKDKKFNQQVIVFKITSWKGNPTESDEMKPQWFPFKKIPYSHMWPDDIHWLPKVLKGKFVIADSVFGINNTILEYSLSEQHSL